MPRALKLYLFGVALAASASLCVAGAPNLYLGQRAVATLVVVPAGGNVAGNVDIYVVFHNVSSKLYFAPAAAKYADPLDKFPLW